MKPLIILITVFTISSIIFKALKGNFQLARSGQIAMSVMLIFTAIGHFVFPKGMAMMIPELIPFRNELVYFTGIIEIIAAIGLLIPKTQSLTAWLLITFFIAILPANIYGAIHHIDFQNATFNGKGLNYLWFRVPLQIMFIVWVYFFVIKKSLKYPDDFRNKN